MKPWLALLLVLSAACESPFGPPTLVDRPRLLEIRALPPEISASDSVVTLQALIGNPTQDVLSCRWAACLVDIGWVAGAIDCPGDQSLVFGDECAAASVSIEQLMQWYLSQGGQLPEELPQGVDETQLPLFIGLEIRFGERRLRGLKRLRLNIQNDEPNTNPRIRQLQLADGSALPQPWRVRIGETVALRPLAEESSLQTFLDGKGQTRREDMLFSWFATAGRFTDRRTIWGEDAKGRRLEVNHWYLDPEWSRPGPATLWLVARDGRWGADWLQVDVEILEAER